MPETPRLLLLMRHAEAENFVPGLGDIDRPLTDEGKEQARRVGEALDEQGVTIDQVLCSAASRTRETAELLDIKAPIAHTEAIYNAGSDTIREALAEADDEARAVLIVGHAPGIPALVEDLIDEAATDPDILYSLSRGFSTATIVGIEIGGSWVHPSPGRAVLAFNG